MMEAYQVLVHVNPEHTGEDLLFIVPSLECVTNVLLSVGTKHRFITDATITKILL